jgi:hypothetical protein
MNFLDGVNRILRTEGVIAGDDDNASSFSDTAHENMLNLAKIAVQDSLSDFISDRSVPFEQAESYITFTTGTRLYSLASDFMRFIDPKPKMYKVDVATTIGIADGTFLYSYKGGEKQLRADIFDYQTVRGDPYYFYGEGGTTKQIGVYPVPNSDSNGEIYRYYYDKDVSVSVETDTLPFINESTAQAFIQSASVWFRALRIDPIERKQLFPQGIERDSEYQNAKSRVIELINQNPPATGYGRVFR